MPTRFIEGKRCLQCNGPIRSRGPVRDAKAMFCSSTCRGAHQRAQSIATGKIITKPCETCGKAVTFHVSMRPRGAYCSVSCKSIGHSAKMTGRALSEYGKSATFRKSMRRFFYDRCSICGWDEAPCDVAHIEARKNGGYDALENVTMLCPNHHRLFDLGLIPVEAIQQARVSVLK